MVDSTVDMDLSMFKEIDQLVEELKPEDEEKAHREFIVKRL